MLATIKEKGNRKGLQIEERFYSFQGENQGRCYINFNGKTISLNPNIKDFDFGAVVELDDYKSTRQNKSTTEHGARQPRKAKTPYVASDYLDEKDAKAFAQLEEHIEKAKAALADLTAKYAAYIEKAGNNYKAQQDALKAKKQAEQQAKQEQAKAKKLAMLEKLAKELGVKIA